VRILIVHNHYRSAQPSGENRVFELERALLQRSGHHVETLESRSDELVRQGALGALRGAASAVWNPFTPARVRAAVRAFRPDIVHAHNTFPLLSPSVFPAVEPPAARVLTLHNYRLVCPAATPVREGRACTECIDARSVLPSIRHGCYRGSRLATLPVAAGVALARARGVWARHVEAFVALTEFQRDVMVRAGLPADRVFVKPNFYPGDPPVVPWAERADRAVFAGRLSHEKGVADLIAAWAAWGDGAPELRVVGDGPLRVELERAIRARGASRVTFLGQLPPEAAEAEIGRAKLVVVASICFEGFPMVLREGFALGTPAAVSAIGPLPGLVAEGPAGVVFPPGEPAALLAAVRALWADPARHAGLAAAARRAFETRYGEAPNLAALVCIYEAAVAARRAAAR
jgi:glycosyltransferase involved in cell wall biosynthesis